MKRFRINSPRVMHETIEGEVILIDLTTGSYFSLRDAGAVVWQAVTGGADEQRIGGILEQRYIGSPEEIQSGVRRLLEQLADEELIVQVDSTDEPLPELDSLQNGRVDRAPFQAPTLEKYTDMQDLILLDPVHEVDARGWPHTSEGERRTA
jgi:hypothetical protein